MLAGARVAVRSAAMALAHLPPQAPRAAGRRLVGPEMPLVFWGNARGGRSGLRNSVGIMGVWWNAQGRGLSSRAGNSPEEYLEIFMSDQYSDGQQSSAEKTAKRETRAKKIVGVLQEHAGISEDMAWSVLGGASGRRFLRLSAENIKAHIVYFRDDLGLKDKDIGKLLERAPRIFEYSVDKRLRHIQLFFENNFSMSKGVFADMVAKYPQIVGLHMEKNLMPTVELIVAEVTGQSKLMVLMRQFPQVLGYRPETIREKIELVDLHLNVDREERMKILGSYPMILGLNMDDNIIPTINYLFNVCKLSRAEVLSNPSTLGLSLDRRIKPRHEFMVLMEDKYPQRVAIQEDAFAAKRGRPSEGSVGRGLRMPESSFRRLVEERGGQDALREYHKFRLSKGLPSTPPSP